MIKEILLRQDVNLFIFINHLPHNYFIHSFFASLSGVGSWGLVWILWGIILFIWEEKKDHKKLLSLIFAALISWISVEVVLKNIFKRVRPELIIPGTISMSEKLFTYSFPSFHATVSFAAAFILSRKHKKLKWLYYLLAVLISFSRIYLGKHYPSDVIAGALLGLCIGAVSIKSADYFFHPTSKSASKRK